MKENPLKCKAASKLLTGGMHKLINVRTYVRTFTYVHTHTNTHLDQCLQKDTC